MEYLMGFILKRRTLGLVGFLAIAAAMVLPANEVLGGDVVSLKTQSEVSGSVIRLADLVVEQQQGGLPQVLANLVLGQAPLPGGKRILDGNHIRAQLRQAGFDPYSVYIAPNSQIAVTRGSQQITRQAMSEWVRRYLAHRMADTPAEMEIGEIRMGQDLTLPAGALSHKIVPPKNQALSGKVPLSIHCYVDGQEVRKVWAVVKIILRSDVVVARKPLRRHKVINADDIKIVAMDLAQLPSGVVTNPDEVVGRRTQRKIDPNTVLRADLVELPPLVKRRDVVVILAEAPGLTISTLGEAQENGRLGERIRVTNIDSRKRVHARVVDATTVRVDF